MSYKRMTASQHMAAAVAAMSEIVFSQYTYLENAGASIGYGDMEEKNDDPMEALVLDLLLQDAPSALTCDAILQKHMRMADSTSGIVALRRSAWKKKF